MRILMLNYEFPPMGGGAANANHYLLKELGKLPKDYVSIDLVTSSALNRFQSVQYADNVKIYRLDINKKKMHYWTMAEITRWTKRTYDFCSNLIDKNKYDLCHCWFGWPGGLIGYKFRKKVPYIIALRGSDVPGFNPRLKTLDPILFKPISKKVWKNANSAVVNSKGLETLAKKTLNRKYQMIPNGVDTEEFKPPTNKKFGKNIRLVSTGRLIGRKGYGHLIEALAGLKGFELTLIGEGNLENELKTQAEDAGVKVKFLGRVEHEKMPAHLRKADIFVLPSLNEGMSNSVLEAMASGLPVVVTDVGGTKELVRENGTVVKKGSVKSLRMALKKYDEKLIKKQGKVSRKIAEGMSWEKVGEQYLELYKEVLGE